MTATPVMCKILVVRGIGAAKVRIEITNFIGQMSTGDLQIGILKMVASQSTLSKEGLSGSVEAVFGGSGIMGSDTRIFATRCH